MEMVLHSKYSPRGKNKWVNQLIHKKYNRIQYASKHYIYVNQNFYENNNTIFKKKYPLKQRRDRKKFKAQRKRKKVLKQMTFDYNDFILKNKNENFKRITTKPTIQYNNIKDIKSMYDEYYYPSDDQHKYPYSVNNIHQYEPHDIDRVIVNMEIYSYKEPTETVSNSDNSQQTKIPIASNYNVYNNGRWNWRQYVPQNASQENGEIQRAIVASLNEQQKPGEQKHVIQASKLKTMKFVTTYTSIYGNKTCDYPQYIGKQQKRTKNKEWPYKKMAIRAWNIYKNHLNIKNDHEHWKEDNGWNIITNNDMMDLYSVLSCTVPYLYDTMYDIIFEFMGYRAIHVHKIKAVLSLLCKDKVISKNTNTGIKYFNPCLYGKRSTFCGFTKDFENNRFISKGLKRELGMNTNDGIYYEMWQSKQSEWNVLKYVTNRKEQSSKQKKKCIVMKEKTGTNEHYDDNKKQLQCRSRMWKRGHVQYVYKWSRGWRGWRGVKWYYW